MILKPGQTYSFDGIEIILSTQSHLPFKILTRPKLPVTSIEIGSRLDIESESIQKHLRDLLFTVAKAVAPILLIEPARLIAMDIGVSPTEWRVSKARKRALGTCDSRRVVSFSPLLVFTPEEIRKYITCHELAHLTHFNHSPLFHNLCNNYTLQTTGKPEAYFKRKLKEIFRDPTSLAYSLSRGK